MLRTSTRPRIVEWFHLHGSISAGYICKCSAYQTHRQISTLARTLHFTVTPSDSGIAKISTSQLVAPISNLEQSALPLRCSPIRSRECRLLEMVSMCQKEGRLEVCPESVAINFCKVTHAVFGENQDFESVCIIAAPTIANLSALFGA